MSIKHCTVSSPLSDIIYPLMHDILRTPQLTAQTLQSLRLSLSLFESLVCKIKKKKKKKISAFVILKREKNMKSYLYPTQTQHNTLMYLLDSVK